MANPEYVKLLQVEVRAWNAWRREYPGVELDLREADLREADLIGADLRGADLSEAKLSGAKLSGAKLRSAKLIGADLWGADLSGANLKSADLREADLDGSCIGRILDVYAQNAFDHRGTRWTRLFVGTTRQFEPGHAPEDSGYWLLRSGQETIHEALRRLMLKELADADLAVEFTGPVRAERHVVEMLLEETMGHGDFEIRKALDRFSVTFRDKDDLLAGFMAVVSYLAALHTLKAGSARRVAVRDPVTGEVTSLQGPELDQVLEDLGEQIRKGELNWADEFLVWFARETPFGPSFERLLSNSDVQKTTHVRVSAVYGLAMELFLSVRNRRGELADTRREPLALPRTTSAEKG